MPLSVHGPMILGLPCTVEPILVHGPIGNSYWQVNLDLSA